MLPFHIFQGGKTINSKEISIHRSMILKPDWKLPFPQRKSISSKGVPCPTFFQCNSGAQRFSDTKGSTITEIWSYFLVKNLSVEEFELQSPSSKELRQQKLSAKQFHLKCFSVILPDPKIIIAQKGRHGFGSEQFLSCTFSWDQKKISDITLCQENILTQNPCASVGTPKRKVQCLQKTRVLLGLILRTLLVWHRGSSIGKGTSISFLSTSGSCASCRIL